jgi:tRNA G18 (ribose-2'-O)-methylase SpoU
MDAFACEAVYLCGITGTPPHRDIQKTALGATETVPWQYFESALHAVKELKNKGYKIVALEIAEGSTDIRNFSASAGEKIALILGNEVNGVDQQIIDICDVCLEIPQYGTKHSLNVSVSAGIALWEICKGIRRG